jgi:hypothetical protein
MIDQLRLQVQRKRVFQRTAGTNQHLSPAESSFFDALNELFDLRVGKILPAIQQHLSEVLFPTPPPG